MKFLQRYRSDVLIASALMLMAGACILFLDKLVAPPKVLMGRSLTAIPPSMFPNIILSLLLILCALFLFARLREEPEVLPEGIGTPRFQEGLAFFALLTCYALAFVPLGFLISTSLTMAAMSWLVGNRSVIQIVILCLVAPVLLYLTATRLLAVSLPELNFLETLYARLLG